MKKYFLLSLLVILPVLAVCSQTVNQPTNGAGQPTDSNPTTGSQTTLASNTDASTFSSGSTSSSMSEVSIPLRQIFLNISVNLARQERERGRYATVPLSEHTVSDLDSWASSTVTTPRLNQSPVIDTPNGEGFPK